jgi:short-subunit dehydrogenase
MVITGASSGIGAATARLFGAKNYRIVLAARRRDRLEKLAAQINSDGGDVLPITTDVSDLSSIEELVDRVIKHFQQVDILFNNAGFGRLDWLENLDPVKDIQSQLNVNLGGLIQMTRAVLPYMVERRRGHIINMSSVAGFVATPTYTIYAASKFGVRGFSEALRREVGVFGIHVSAIFPGGVTTEFKSHTGAKRRSGTTTPSALRLNAEDVAKTVLRVVKHPRHTVVIPIPMKAAVWLNTLMPGLLDRLIERMFVRRERGL